LSYFLNEYYYIKISVNLLEYLLPLCFYIIPKQEKEYFDFIKLTDIYGIIILWNLTTENLHKFFPSMQSMFTTTDYMLNQKTSLMIISYQKTILLVRNPAT
jgi:hypothetical protein